MSYDPMRHHRRSIRLRGYDYSAEGVYSVTICTRNRECTLGEVVDGKMIYSDIGRVADACWLAIPNDLQNVWLDEYQIMPNHIHGIVVLWEKHPEVGDENSRRDLMAKGDSERDLINQIPPGTPIPQGHQRLLGDRISLGLVAGKFSTEVEWPLMKNPKQTLGKIVRHFKAKAAKLIHDAGFIDFAWQRGYYDHIIRDEHDLERVRLYIRNNPMRWSENDGKGIERA